MEYNELTLQVVRVLAQVNGAHPAYEALVSPDNGIRIDSLRLHPSHGQRLTVIFDNAQHVNA